MKVIAWTYNAGHHCIPCAKRAFGWKLDYPEKLGKPLDSEGNEAQPLFDTDEWYANDLFDGNETAVLGCGTCGHVIERRWLL